MKRTIQAMVLAAGLASAAAFAQDTATITQTAALNEAAINQAGNAGANDAAIAQNSPGNQAFIEQSALGLVRPDNTSSAAITQGGDGEHYARIEQNNSDRVTATITQEGHASRASVRQVGSQLATVELTQSGVNQLASLIQSNEVPTAGEAANLIRLSQAGEGNSAYVLQHGANAVVDGSSQSGSFNYASIDQGGVESFISFSQDGFNNQLTISQQSANSSVSATQSSSNNVASIEQNDTFVSSIAVAQSGSGNTARLYQDTTNRTSANVEQTGSDNFARIRQDNIDSAQASIVQASSNNFADIVQTGVVRSFPGPTATILQSGGNGNSATITQHN